MSVKLKKQFETETGNKEPSNQIFYHEWHYK